MGYGPSPEKVGLWSDTWSPIDLISGQNDGQMENTD